MLNKIKTSFKNSFPRKTPPRAVIAGILLAGLSFFQIALLIVYILEKIIKDYNVALSISGFIISGLALVTGLLMAYSWVGNTLTKNILIVFLVESIVTSIVFIFSGATSIEIDSEIIYNVMFLCISVYGLTSLYSPEAKSYFSKQPVRDSKSEQP